MAESSSSAAAIQLVHEHRRAGRMAQAERVCREELRRQPGDAHMLHLLGMLCSESGRDAEALELIRQAVKALPGRAQFHQNLGTVLGRLGRDDEAASAFTQAVKLQPGYAEAHGNLAAAMQRLGQFAKAEAAARKVIELRPDSSAGHVQLGGALTSLGRNEEAIGEFQSAIGLNPKSLDAWKGLLAAMEHAGRLDEVLECYQRAIALFPDDSAIHSARLYLLHYHPGFSPQYVFDEHTAWAKRFAEPLTAKAAPHDNERSPNRQLRIGYISADFREHPTARYIEPILAAHDRGNFEIYCYSDVTRPDKVTERCRQAAEVWRDVHRESDEQVANTIRRDRIDILVETTGHMPGNRLKVCAMRPAPIQVALPMYPGTSGMPVIDYFITDGLVDPPGLTDHLYVERLIQLEELGRCWRPDDNSPPTIPLPAEVNGRVTFGAFNRLSKVTDAMLACWAHILDGVPGSRLQVLVEGPGGEQTCPSIRERFARFGLTAERVRFIGRQPRWQYLQTLASADICLDTFPYNGCTTTCDSLWMGTPVVTLARSTHVSRVAFSFLSQVGLADLSADSCEKYVQTAVNLANDRERLRHIRIGLRQRMLASPLTNAGEFTKALERELRKIWIGC